MSTRLQGVNNGPTVTITVDTPIVAGTTASYTEFAAFGPIQIITDTVFESDCVAVGGSQFAPDSTVTYPAGYIMRKYLTTIHLASGSIDAVPLKTLPEYSF